MGNTIHWETDYGAALKKAQSEQKPILLDFFNPG
ncbi:MAG: hypothetical protein A4E62_00225 [Syntrophorhabdus sp. PtaU1.Bin002]|nr:MAG: hypothetical protein A4E58_02836 [Syntrophorhabdus sp. PtaB.Bin006]OPY73835.1 MAG: hypothetical protein A4E62_00225 [Syntrophorhabdus sp. PtaU1.Bin002]